MPLHPPTIHFPIVFWCWGTFSDLAFWATADLYWQRSATLALSAGELLGLATLVAGFVDFIRFTPAGRALREVYVHMGVMSVAWSGFLCLLIFRSPSGLPDRAHMIHSCTEVLLVGLCFLGAHIGGRLAYVFGVGVDKSARTVDNQQHGETPIDRG